MPEAVDVIVVVVVIVVIVDDDFVFIYHYVVDIVVVVTGCVTEREKEEYRRFLVLAPGCHPLRAEGPQRPARTASASVKVSDASASADVEEGEARVCDHGASKCHRDFYGFILILL